MLHTTCLLLALALPQNTAAPTRDVQDPSGPFGYELFLAPGEVLRGYRWDGGPPVPYFGHERVVRIDHGERGLWADARLYLPGTGVLEGLASGAHNLDVRALSVGRGRFGAALRFGPGSFLRVALPAAAGNLTGWTLSFWLRPEGGALGRALVLLPGAVEVRLQSDGRLKAALLPSGEQLTHPDPLALGAWSHVSVSYDPSLLRQLRLAAGSRGVNVPFPAVAPARIPAELQAGDLAHDGRGFVGLLDELALEPGAASTARALRDSRAAPAAGEHELAIVTNLGQRAVKPTAGATRELWLDGAADFAAGALDGVVEVGGELRWAPARWERLRPLHEPPPRTTHALVSLGGGRVFTFSGETRDTHNGPMRNTPDTWLYDGAANAWSEVAAPLAPPPRCHVPAAYSPDHDLVLVAGGWRNDYTPGNLYADTWVFHVGSRTWEQRFPSGPAIGNTSDVGLVYLPELQQFLLLRWRQNWLYDPVANAWTALPQNTARTEGGQPVTYSVGGSPMCALDPRTGLVLVFGGNGATASDFVDTTALYDVRTNAYTVLAPPVRPAARVRAAFAYDPLRDRFVLFGGVRDQFSVRYDDLWSFDPRARQWTELECSNRPSRRGGYYGMAYDEVRARFVLWGGRENPDLWNDETWVLAVDERRAGTALFTLDRLQGWARGTFQADVVAPGGSAVAFRFRTSDTGAGWSPWSALASFGRARYVQVAAILQPGPQGEVPRIRALGLR